MPILCYTTTVEPAKTVAEIQRLLTNHGVRAVLVENGPDRLPAAVAFQADTQFGTRYYRLPARLEGVHAALMRAQKRGKVSRAHAAPEHARRVAWRITLEWVKVQLAVIESGLVTIDEVMLPYMQLGDRGGSTVYEAIKGSRLALPGPGQ